MQNRSMFPFRRHGSKKRSKGPGRKSRGPQRPLPNSARDLLPMLQPATKALAQVLAGRAGASGQLNHARNLLAHAERLINDRVHNRLIPAEREEFFEQLARLRLTLADAEAEAEVQAAEEQVERQPPPPPVAHERLKEMALALSRPERDRARSPRAADEADKRQRRQRGPDRGDLGRDAGRRHSAGATGNRAPSGLLPTCLAAWCCPRRAARLCAGRSPSRLHCAAPARTHPQPYAPATGPMRPRTETPLRMPSRSAPIRRAAMAPLSPSHRGAAQKNGAAYAQDQGRPARGLGSR